MSMTERINKQEQICKAPSEAHALIGALSQSEDNSADTAKSSAQNPPSCESHKPVHKWRLVLGLIALILVIAYFGFSNWVKQPGYCLTMCHTPMAYYVNTFHSEQTVERGPLLIGAHGKAGLVCIDCHNISLEDQRYFLQQIIDQNYEYDTETGRITSPTGTRGDTKSCTNVACHGKPLAVLAEDTYNEAYNWSVHDFGPHENYDCGDCHKVHQTSTLVCTECHAEAFMALPVGWKHTPYAGKSQ